MKDGEKSSKYDRVGVTVEWRGVVRVGLIQDGKKVYQCIDQGSEGSPEKSF